MEHTALVTGADRGLGLALCADLLDRGWRVFAGQYMPDWPQLDQLKQQCSDNLTVVPLDVGSGESVQKAAEQVAAETDRIDLLINNAGIRAGSAMLGEGLEFEAMQNAYNVNTLGPIRTVEAFLPLMEEGMRRLCFVSSEAGCISLAYRQDTFGYCMSKTALNMAVRIMHNDLYDDGYTFRLYHPGWMRSYMGGTKNIEAELEPEQAAECALRFFLGDRDDEGRLVMVDYQGLGMAILAHGKGDTSMPNTQSTAMAGPGVAFVTGADRGLGFALSERLLVMGWCVFAGQYMPDWPQLDALATQHGQMLTTIPLDVADTASTLMAAEIVRQSTDRIDLLINNAAVLSLPAGPIREAQDYDGMHRQYNINALGPTAHGRGDAASDGPERPQATLLCLL